MQLRGCILCLPGLHPFGQFGNSFEIGLVVIRLLLAEFDDLIEDRSGSVRSGSFFFF
jgi:hypothetical protein